MIRLEDISMSFAGKSLLENVSLQLNKNEKVGLIGRNGSGKSTLLKLLLKSIEPDEGRIIIPKNYKLGILKQDISFSYNSVIDEVVNVLPIERSYESWKGEKILAGLGFSESDMLDNPLNFSGGNQVKINLARLLMEEPDLLLLDEPTNYLDIYSIKWLKKFLNNWKNELILITHDRSFMDSIISHTLFIHRKKTRKTEGATTKLINMVNQEETIYESTRKNKEKQRKKTEEWIDRFKAKATLASRAQSKLKMLEKEDIQNKLTDISDLDFDFNYLEYKSKNCLLEAESLKFGYDPNDLLIKNLSFRINKGDKVCVIGKNGKGKSTLLKLLNSEENLLSGNIIKHPSVEIGYFGQMNIERLNSNLSIFEELLKDSSITEETRIRKVCAQVMFSGNDADKKIKILSGGERSRVMLGKILLKNVNLLFLDEPTNHLDMESTDSLMKAVKNFQGSVVMVTHDESFLNEIANKLIIYDAKKVYVFNGEYKDFLKKEGWKEKDYEQL